MTMQDYTSYCTAEQTCRAYKLGAPIDRLSLYIQNTQLNNNEVVIDNYVYCCPTTQQMIGWLREKGFWIYAKRYWQRDAFYACFEKQGLARIECTDDFEKPEQAELAAIDAVLDYLEKGGIK